MKLARVWLGLSFAEALELTPFELVTAINANADRALQERRLQAMFVSRLMNLQGKSLTKPITGDELLGIQTPDDRELKTKDQLIAEASQGGRTYADYCKEHGLEPGAPMWQPRR